MIDLKKLLCLTPILLLLLATSCKDDDIDESKANCTFVQNDEDNDGRIDENESQIMSDCWNNPLTSKAEIKANLIGEWTLVGHGIPWFSERSLPCASLEFTESSLMFNFEDSELDTEVTTSWDIVISQNGGFLLDTEYKGEGSYALRLSNFCAEYVIMNETPFDGPMYIYQKGD